MVWIDFIIGGLLLWAAISGFHKGFILELAGLLGLILGIWAGMHFSRLAAAFLKETFHLEGAYLPVLSFVVVFILVLLGMKVLGKILEKSAEVLLMGWINKLLGLVFGLLKQALILSFVLMILNTFAASGDIINKEQQKKSYCYYPIKSIAPLMLPAIKTLKKDLFP